MCGRKLWVLSYDGIDRNDLLEADRRRRARIYAAHAKNNENWKRSEFTWEVDAWSDVFNHMRDDPCLTM